MELGIYRRRIQRQLCSSRECSHRLWQRQRGVICGDQKSRLRQSLPPSRVGGGAGGKRLKIGYTSANCFDGEPAYAVRSTLANTAEFCIDLGYEALEDGWHSLWEMRAACLAANG